MSTPPVLIVGSGPSGLVAALALRMNGIPVRIIEKKATYPIGQRGSGLHPRTLEIHHFLGTLDDICSTGTLIQPMRWFATAPHGDKIVKEFDMVEYKEPTASIPYHNPILIGQNQQEEILRNRLATYDCRVELNTELQSFEQHEDHVAVTIVKHGVDGQEATENTKFRWLIGADGARGMVRKALAFSFLGETRMGDNLVLGDIHVPNVDETLTRDFWCAWGDIKGTALTMRPTSDKNIVNFIGFGPDLRDWTPPVGREDFIKLFNRVTGRTDIQFGDLVWMGTYRPNIRMVEKFGENRVFLVGDAAHVHSPTGGQGMNSSIQDSYNLAWKLALIERGLAPKSLLDTYSEERIPIIAEMLQITTGLLNKTRKGEEDGWKRGGALDMLGVNYRSSSIILDERSPEAPGKDHSYYDPPRNGVVQAGDRAPDAPGLIRPDGRETRLFNLFGPSHHTVLIFTKDPKPITTCLKKYPNGTIKPVVISGQYMRLKDEYALVDRDGHATKTYSIDSDKDTIVVVRPDGVIGGIVFSEEGLNKYFQRIFI